MPTYEYECKKCSFRFEEFQKITDGPLKKCPKCKGVLKRLLGTGAGILFKGSGFYSTDYRSDSYTKTKEKEEKTTSAKEESKKSDKSPETQKKSNETKKKE
ncbi:FmdB family zinc ribbon protein [Chlamydiota bacterium]